MHAHKVVRHLAAAAFVAGLATASLSVISTQAVGASTGTQATNVQRIIANVNDCLHGGYVNYSTTTGKTFKNAVGCAIYALFGGTLVALPDLVLIPSCTSTPGYESCDFVVENIGLGPATGNLVLNATLTAPQPISLPTSDANANCTGATAQNMVTVIAVPSGATGTVSCTTTLPPGTSTVPFVFDVQVGGGAASGQSLTITAVVNPNHTIVESNYANDTFSQTFVIS